MLTNTAMITKKRHPRNFAQEKYSVYRKIGKETINSGRCSVLKVYCMSYLWWRPMWWCWWIQEGISLVVSWFSNLNLTIKQWQDYFNVLNAGSFSFCINDQNKSCEQVKVTLSIDRNKEVSFFSSYIKKDRMTSNPRSSLFMHHWAQQEIDTSAISEIEDITTQPIGEDQVRQETR